MAQPVWYDRVKETSATTGTGTLTLAGAQTGFQAFSAAVPTGATVTFTTEDGTNWEVAEGVYTTSGTTLTRARILASSNAGAAVSWTAGSRNVFLTLAARDVVTTAGIMYGRNGTTGCIAATYDRMSADPSFGATAPNSGGLKVIGLSLPAALSITNISFFSGTTAAGTPTHQWFVLLDSSLNVLAKTADDTSTAWAASTKKTLAITGGPYITTYTGLYYLGIVVTATTVPTIESVAGGSGSGSRGMAPIAGGNSTSSLTTPASLPSPASAITSGSLIMYVELS